ncbi:MAG: carbamoyltransferase C-terminal domain-containing protein [Haliscomenobacter sp.]|uniref:carbamoyltransferase family protein n=1 Tax=Haliscomenobacter sp. TaxID=2717303 RepID=UPI0029B86F05|nr:carbamoyltransferase C-terminal domain-containing protein [Haliscomenobacter sp.]MDX2067879.1 carbamoyltransferase C-terminal domain-containing protein [Haliscomenobacter sp.]
MYTLGLNAYHGDSSACIYRHSELLVATEEERIRRIKHWAGLPTEAVKFCLAEAGITLAEVDVIAISRDPQAKFMEKVWYTLRKGVKLRSILDRAKNSLNVGAFKKELAEAFGYQESDLKARVVYAEHHRSHLASAYFVSPFADAALLSIDGMGDFSSTMRGYTQNGKMEVIDSVSYPHSLGIFYTALTQWLGFPHYGDEYKVMGLAPYGQPTELDKVAQFIHLKDNGLFELNPRFFRHFKEGVNMDWQGGSPHVGTLYTEALCTLLGPARSPEEPLSDYHRNVATSVQRMAEKVIFHLAEDLQRKTGQKNLCLAGGVAQNSVANGKLLANTSFEKLFVPPAGHDAGTSIGAALYALHQLDNQPRAPFRHQAYTGACFSNEQIEAYLQSRGISYQRFTDEELFPHVAEALHQGAVIGWFQGRAEFGPRALGNRSIIVDPSRPDAKDLLNSKIKRRESFRPFAPSILKEAVLDYFEQDDDVPFMEKVFLIRPEKRAVIPAVTHVDGTGRLQTVEEQDNPRYYRLIKTFAEKSGVPILLNTSFNENEPIVNTPEHALECFLRTQMDLLVLENVVVSR